MVILKHYKWDLFALVVVGLVVLMKLGPLAALSYLLLVVVEISLSGDNATVNVGLLKQLSKKWVTIFMTVGVLIAAGFMRFLFPIIIVSITGHMSFGDSIHLALTNHEAYKHHVEAAHPQIAVFGGVYLLMIALTFFIVENAKNLQEGGFWFEKFERPLALIGEKIEDLATIVTLAIVVVAALAAPGEYTTAILFAGVISLGSFLFIKSISGKKAGNQTNLKGWAAFGVFCALEAQDSAFSFDGVSGALAITTDPIIIAAGLGVGALFVRSATKHLMETDTLAEYRYMEHGAFYAILVLAISQVVSLFVEVPGWLVGILSVGIISGSVYHSHVINKREGTGESLIDEMAGIDVLPSAEEDTQPIIAPVVNIDPSKR